MKPIPSPRVQGTLAFAALFATHCLCADAQQDFDAPTQIQPVSAGNYATPGYPPQNIPPPARNGAAPGIPAQDEFPVQPGAGMTGTMPGMQPGATPAMPNAPGGAAPSNPFASAGAPANAPTFDAGAVRAALQSEREDFGVPPQPQLQTTLHGPTPTSIPGGQTITTDRLLELYRQAGQNGLLVFNALGPGMDLPYAQNAVGATQPGAFDDQTQQQFGQYLQQVTQGNTARPLVFYCMNTHCWMSYNAALRAIHLGFRQVYWYRGGIEAWQRMQQLSAAMTPPQNPAAQGPGENRPGY